jgi:hypothetical protein
LFFSLAEVSIQSVNTIPGSVADKSLTDVFITPRGGPRGVSIRTIGQRSWTHGNARRGSLQEMDDRAENIDARAGQQRVPAGKVHRRTGRISVGPFAAHVAPNSGLLLRHQLRADRSSRCHLTGSRSTT